MKKIKRVLLLLFVATLALTFTACTTDNGPMDNANDKVTTTTSDNKDTTGTNDTKGNN